MVSTAIPPGVGTPGVATDNPPRAYAVPKTLTTAVTRTATRDAHQGVSGYKGFGVGGRNVPPGPRFGGVAPGVLIVYFRRLVLLSMNNNGWWWF
jgi:hypothetical protein